MNIHTVNLYSILGRCKGNWRASYSDPTGGGALAKGGRAALQAKRNAVGNRLVLWTGLEHVVAELRPKGMWARSVNEFQISLDFYRFLANFRQECVLCVLDRATPVSGDRGK